MMYGRNDHKSVTCFANLHREKDLHQTKILLDLLTPILPSPISVDETVDREEQVYLKLINWMKKGFIVSVIRSFL